MQLLDRGEGERHVRRALLEGVSVEHDKSSEVVGFALELIGDGRLEFLFAVLEKTEQFALVRKLKMPRFVKRQKELFARGQRIINVDDLLGCIENSKDLPQRRLDGFRNLAALCSNIVSDPKLS